MCCGFTAYLKAAYEKTLLGAHETSTDVSGQVAVKMQLNGLSTREWGLSGRQHIHNSFQNGAINLDDPAIAALSMRVSM